MRKTYYLNRGMKLADSLDSERVTQNPFTSIHFIDKQDKEIKEELAQKGLDLYDIKLEFGRDQETGEVLLIDVVVLSILIYALLGKLADSLARLLERLSLGWHPAFQNA